MTTIDAELEIAQWRSICGQHMHIDAEAIAQHAERIANTAFTIKRVANRQRMNEVTFCCKRLLRTSGQHAANISLFDFMTAKIDARGEGFALEAASRNIDDEAVDGQTGHALSSIHCEANGLFSRIQIDNDAGLHTARALMTDTKHFHAMRAAWQQRATFMWTQACNHAGNLA